MKIEKFDRATCRTLRLAMNRALVEAGIEGVEFAVGNMSFNDTECNIKVKATTAGNSEARDDIVSLKAKLHGIAALTNDTGWKLVDFHSKKSKYPFIATDAAGKRYKLSPAQAQAKFGRAA